MFKSLSLLKDMSLLNSLTFFFLPLPFLLLFTAKLLKIYVYPIYLFFTSQSILSPLQSVTGITPSTSLRAPITSMLLNVIWLKKQALVLLDICSTHCWLSNQLLFLYSFFIAKITILFRFLLPPNMF